MPQLVLSPTVSMLIANYNCGHYLEQAITSVLVQTYQDFELLIWDDGSTDHSLDIAYRYAEKDSRVRVVAAEHRGIAASRIAAISQLTGAYLGWVDSDDWLAPTTLAKTVSVLERHPNCGLTYTDHWVTNENGEGLEIGPRCLFPYSPVLLLKVLMTYHFRLIRRSVFNAVGGITTLYPYAYDYDLCLRLSEHTEVTHIPEPLYYYRVHPEAISSQKKQLQIRDAWAAIAAALERRGMSDRYEVTFNQRQYALQRKETLRQ